MTDLAKKYRLKDHLDMYWLRPESALWDAVAAKHIGTALKSSENILELGIGNGFFSFIMLGGRFDTELDWFRNIDLSGYWENKDVYDTDIKYNPADYIKKMPTKGLKFALDHKKNLLRQAESLGFIDKTVLHDGNLPIVIDGMVDTIYSNILYWLKEPIDVIKGFDLILKDTGSRVVLVFPNHRFYEYCKSYTQSTPLWKLVNRGRSDHIMWSKDLDEFVPEVEAKTNFKIVYASAYLSDMTLGAWDIGLRPMLPMLTKLTNKMNDNDRKEFKIEWVSSVMPFLNEMLSYEETNGAANGGYNLVVLEK